MSIANLYAQSTKKDMNLFADSLTVDILNVETLTTENLIVNNDATIGNDLTVDGLTILNDDVTINADEILTGDLTIDGDVKLNGANSMVYNKQFLFTYNPSTTSTIFTQYLGTMGSPQGVVEIKIADSGSSYGAGSLFRVSRCFAQTPVVFHQHSGDVPARFYTLFHRIISDSVYELYFTVNDAITNADISFIASVTTRANLQVLVPAQNDTGIVICTYGIASTEDGNVAIGKPSTNNIRALDVIGNIESDSAIYAGFASEPGSLGYIVFTNQTLVFGSGF